MFADVCCTSSSPGCCSNTCWNLPTYEILGGLKLLKGIFLGNTYVHTMYSECTGWLIQVFPQISDRSATTRNDFLPYPQHTTDGQLFIYETLFLSFQLPWSQIIPTKHKAISWQKVLHCQHLLIHQLFPSLWKVSDTRCQWTLNPGRHLLMGSIDQFGMGGLLTDRH
jgi:hypothetical protein